MMTMLHSVWSGGGSAAGRRRSLLALGALLALVASVLVWAAPTQAQGTNLPPDAIALVPTLSADENTMTVQGNLSLDPDDGDTSGPCVGCTFKWEVVTATWRFLQGYGGDSLTTATARIDTTNIDFNDLASSAGALIEFKLTVTDAKGASDSTTATYNIKTNEAPTADISLSAMLADPNAAAGATTAEKYTIDAVIDGPGENGNADNEWDIIEGALLVLDGSGSSDPDGDKLSYKWSLVYEAGTNGDVGFPTNEAGTRATTLVATGATTAKISTDGSVPGTPDVNPTVGRLNVAPAAGAVNQSPYQVVYTLAVTDDTDNAGAVVAVNDGTGDANNVDDTALIRIVIHDQPADPKITAVNIGGDADATDPQIIDAGVGTTSEADRIDRVFPPADRYLVHEGDADADALDITLTPVAFDADQDVNGNGAHVTDGTNDSGETPPTVEWSKDDADTGTTGFQFRIPADAKAGDSFTVTATIPRTEVSKTLTFDVVKPQQRPVATILSKTGLIDLDGDGAGTDVADGGAATDGLVSAAAPTDGLYMPAAPKNGTYTIDGFGFDPDGGSTNSIWTQIDDKGMPVQPGAKGYVPLTGASSDSVSFGTPADKDIKTIKLSFTVTDNESTFDTKTVTVLFTRKAADPKASAGSAQVVAPGSTVTLSGSSDGIPDTATAVTYTWSLKSVSTEPSPATLGTRASAQVHKDLNLFLEVWNQKDLNNLDGDSVPTTDPDPGFATGIGDVDADGDGDPDGTASEFVATEANNFAIGRILQQVSPPATANPGVGQFQYFTAPKLSAGLKYVQITFGLSVSYTPESGTADPKTSEVTITVADTFFSSYINGPDVCRNDSLGGPTTEPHDSNGDGVADTCSLPYTRREAIARQNALQQLADLGLTIDVTDAGTDGTPDHPDDSDPDDRTSGATLTDLVLGRDGSDAVGTSGTDGYKAAVSTVVGTCAEAKELVPDPADSDACDDDATKLSPPPAAIDPADADLYYSGIITGPAFCTDFGLGGAQLYPHDSDGDDVADVCSLPYTRREAVARQLALEKFAAHSQFNNALAGACTALGSATFGASKADLDKDACSVPPGTVPEGEGDALPTPAS